MDSTALKLLLEQVQSGSVGIADALEQLAQLPFEEIDGARVDHHRALRTGFPEVVYGAGKTPDEVCRIMIALATRGPRAMATRVTRQAADLTVQRLPGTAYHSGPGMLVYDADPLPRLGCVAVVSAGTSDGSVAEEAVLTAETMGNRVAQFSDVGVAGLHRLLAVLPKLREARVIITIAGMEGALPSVVAGLVSVPVVAVPTSVGYGASFGGLAPLLAMLNSCATGVSVVNIDNGFGAAAVASMINRAGLM
ncbi:MAG: nickel pincer cofactor biosynthesis protein LarB [Chloroflexi bacterium]|nr:nickel pincer cofactor biosynthesis protein LarB [Chloroflexota bacterium]